MRQFLTRPWGKVALAMLATVAAVAVGQGLPSEARADHYQFNVTVEKSPLRGRDGHRRRDRLRDGLYRHVHPRRGV
jgi:hypothetical protein